VQLHDGIDQLKAIGADVVLMDPQYAPKVLAKAETPDMVEQIALTAKEENVDLFQRFAVMRDWYEVQHLSFDTFVSPDGLHMNDWSYSCVATLLAGAGGGGRADRDDGQRLAAGQSPRGAQQRTIEAGELCRRAAGDRW